ncbi:hypothetical protein B0F90DRAFT_1807310 [Multifurca ochricompacta]|uniref:DNA-binding protein RAP1 n=1 Tax=Multifurca ochricompacta TaxID=376703 RepID=A0AAD4MEC1_9AGAM|nr:hypothetical protein B0F90DRAFT_1807310 [Multifurca ochricompacta]
MVQSFALFPSSVKFFIQKDLPTELQAELCETITALGGRVESKVPRQGFVLIQPNTNEAERLKLCWDSPDRPDRHFVPYTYVEACKIAGILLKQIFVENGEAIKFHIDSSIANINARAALSARIMHSGGDPSASAQTARVILADPNTEIFQHLVKSYQGVPGKYIESYLWVKKCVEKGAVVYTPLVYKNPGGRRPGEERTQFTEEDEEHLCNWIAAKIPYKETGGRTGNRLYQQLCDMASDPEYAWVSRHTWQSWRERYKKNSQRLDTMIQAIVEQKKPSLGEKGQYGYVRKPEEKPKRSRKRKDDGRLSPSRTSHPMAMGMHIPLTPQDGHSHSGIPIPPVPMQTSTANSMGLAIPQDSVMVVRKSPAEEEMEDEEAEWEVKVGTDPPPMWGKRKAGEDSSENGKRTRVSSEQINGRPASGGMHQMARILDIAHEFRFTVEEVQEYYDRARFKKMRDTLSVLADDSDHAA